MALSITEKKAEAKTQLSQLRKELRDMHAGVTENQTMPDPVEVRKAMGKLENLLEMIEPKKSRSKSKSKKSTK